MGKVGKDEKGCVQVDRQSAFNEGRKKETLFKSFILGRLQKHQFAERDGGPGFQEKH